MAFSDARAVLDCWLEAIGKGDIETICQLYSIRPIVMPAFISQTLFDGVSIQEYYQMLLSREDLSVMVYPHTLKTLELGGDKQLLSGVYEVKYSLDDTLLSFPCRFSWLLDMTSQRPILHHHSSQIPHQLL